MQKGRGADRKVCPAFVIVRGRKPNPVLRSQSSTRYRSGDHSSGTTVADGLEHATRPHPRTTDVPSMLDTEDCLRLHAVGFTLPRSSPIGRCALTAPFHPYRSKSAVCFLWHYPWLDDKEPVDVIHHRVLSCSDFPPPSLEIRVWQRSPVHDRIIRPNTPRSQMASTISV